ncbi:MAG: hypothetical protein A3I05_01095 [Deltaproteobacteria bacterium RIFCSPLOWO2_02_FULL_44_10]|nr:MAG: hypothetical protein A3C46_02155 [Deltaproteobacteria bacterium RIFCSPHIGHO2_02_FULL_44_16]OGQ45839.1 MAG: hypothetical protein A3I05_01095 [Deltaproteobacteria bacterium RIFCSPLOWO2_02_FULL_44_10]
MTWLETTGFVLGHCLTTFGEDITYTPKGGAPVVMIGIFDDFYESVDPNTGAIITSQQPIVGIRDLDLGQTPRQDDRVFVRGILYRVKEVQTDGQGGSKLYLHKV